MNGKRKQNGLGKSASLAQPDERTRTKSPWTTHKGSCFPPFPLPKGNAKVAETLDPSWHQPDRPIRGARGTDELIP
jgi:hypothetical protein